MAKATKKNVIMKAALGKETTIFKIVIGVLTFASLYLTLMSALSLNAAYMSAFIMGVPVVVACLFFKNKRRRIVARIITLSAAILYTAVCVLADIQSFVNGVLTFFNYVSAAANQNLHWGFRSFNVAVSNASDFTFASVLAVWLAFGATLLFDRHSLAYIIVSAVTVIVWLCLGLFPQVFAVALLILSIVGLLLSDREFNLKAGICYLVCAAVLLTGLIPCYLYKGSSVVAGFRTDFINKAENIIYGSDSLPEGKIKNSYGMRSSKDVKLTVSLSADTPILYLKGFVGSDFSDNKWRVTDRNTYVQDDYQGLLSFLKANGMETSTQFADYGSVSGNDNSYSVTVKNVSANRKYVYAPYAVKEYSNGSQFYDLNLRSNLFTPSTYEYTVFTGDRSSERVTQAKWLESGADRTQQMREYLVLENEYRNFATKVYSEISPETLQAIDNAFDFRGSVISTATQQIRAYFSEFFQYSDTPDAIEDDFIAEFFGNGISKANSAYFATAATYIFRSYGFAARYVEGYLVRYTGTGDVTDLEITGNNAHAWTEVYFEGMGWLPIEVTPTYYSEEEKDTDVDPTDPDHIEDPVEPIVPPAEPIKPDDPNPPPIIEPIEPLTPEEAKLLAVLKVLTPVSGALLAVAAIILVIVVIRRICFAKRRQLLNSEGEQYGRAAYSIVERDCKAIGGFSEDTLAKCGVAAEDTRRFVELIERSVYGGRNLSVNERKFVEHYISSVAEAISSNGSKIRRFIYKYVKCLGI
ncbi:MAG: transglutaminase-like domain-containing protein [Corallococcus sp.]|nr:transglutaminase-like domain-containing protein [Corallococcus sp.]